MNILVLAKAPIPGHAKTRLNGLLGAKGAANLHQRLVRHTLHTCLEHVSSTCTLVVSEPHPFFTRLSRNTKCQLSFQSQGALGQRMASALGEYTTPTVLVGTDCPALRVDTFEQAFKALASSDIVISPAEDGGFALIGLARPNLVDFAQLFAEIDWGKEKVWQQLKGNIKKLDMHLVCLDTLWDIDTPEDYRRLKDEKWGLL